MVNNPTSNYSNSLHLLCFEFASVGLYLLFFINTFIIHMTLTKSRPLLLVILLVALDFERRVKTKPLPPSNLFSCITSEFTFFIF